MPSSTSQRRIHVPDDTSARSLGADGVAAALRNSPAVSNGGFEIARNGTRGLYWLEPLLEVETASGRAAFGPVTTTDLDDLLQPDGEPNRQHPRFLGEVEELAALKVQNRLTFERLGRTRPLSLADYRDNGGYAGLANALEQSPRDVVELVKHSGLRGRGGAAFPTGIKWQTVLEAEGAQKYIVCNADEGDSGTFADRLVMECDPFALIEGMTIAGYATGASKGFVYIRSEYPQAIASMAAAIETAAEAGCLGDDVLGSGNAFHIEIRKGAGAYICGEETSLLESLEGKRGTIRFRPPLPAIKGLFGQPTVVNNVISLATAPIILREGAEFYRNFGVGKSRGTLTVQLAGNVARGGLYEIDFGMTLNELLHDLGGGTASGRPIKAVQAGGPLGALIPPQHFDTPLDYEAMQTVGGMLGHGGIVVFDDTTDLGALARFSLEFCAIESCGKCTPCRIGAVRGTEVIDRIRADEDAAANRVLLNDLCDTMIDGSLCGLGGMAPLPVKSVLKHFPEEL
ncbi:MAG: NADH-ubiquinone oxidoreductase-F iron-sulfur binding region domain-containing protein [Pseudomonadota bacterium]